MPGLNRGPARTWTSAPQCTTSFRPAREYPNGHRESGLPDISIVELIFARTGRFSFLLLFVVQAFAPQRLPAYSVLTHEAIIDALWDSSIRPLILKKFPATTAEGLREAHGYAYGGCNQPTVKRGVRVIQKELGAKRIKSRVEELFDSGNIDFAVFGSGVIAMHQQGGACRHPVRSGWAPVLNSR